MSKYILKFIQLLIVQNTCAQFLKLGGSSCQKGHNLPISQILTTNGQNVRQVNYLPTIDLPNTLAFLTTNGQQIGNRIINLNSMSNNELPGVRINVQDASGLPFVNTPMNDVPRSMLNIGLPNINNLPVVNGMLNSNSLQFDNDIINSLLIGNGLPLSKRQCVSNAVFNNNLENSVQRLNNMANYGLEIDKRSINGLQTGNAIFNDQVGKNTHVLNNLQNIQFVSSNGLRIDNKDNELINNFPVANNNMVFNNGQFASKITGSIPINSCLEAANGISFNNFANISPATTVIDGPLLDNNAMTGNLPVPAMQINSEQLGSIMSSTLPINDGLQLIDNSAPFPNLPAGNNMENYELFTNNNPITNGIGSNSISSTSNIPLNNLLVGSVLPNVNDIANNNQMLYQYRNNDLPVHNMQINNLPNPNIGMLNKQLPDLYNINDILNVDRQLSSNLPIPINNGLQMGNLNYMPVSATSLDRLPPIPSLPIDMGYGVAFYNNLMNMANTNTLNLGEFGSLPIINGLPVAGITEVVTVLNPNRNGY